MKYLVLTLAFGLGFALSAQAETPAAERAAIASPAVETGAHGAVLKVADQPTKTPTKTKKKKKKKKAPTHSA